MSDLKQLLEFDAFSQAERVTGGDYKTDKATEALGVLLHMDNSDARRRALSAAGDTTFSEPLNNYISIIEAEGFARVLDLPFDGRDGNAEHYFVYFKASEGVLLAFDTYWSSKVVNSGKFYYNWRPSFDPDVAEGRPRGITSSGSYRREPDGGWLWAGDHDCREAVRFHLRQLREHGEFVTPWRRDPRLWLSHYMDTKRDDNITDRIARSKELTAERIGLLPLEVRTAIGAVERS